MGKKKKKQPKRNNAQNVKPIAGESYAENLLQQAISYHRNGDLRRAEMTYRTIISQEPSNSSAYHLLGLIAHQVRKHDQAEALIQKSIALNPDSAVLYANLGNVMKDKKDYAKAAHCYHKAIEINPQFPEAYNGLGIMMCGKGRTEKGIACFKKALSLRPEFAHACNNLGNAYKTLNDNEQAIRYYKKAIQMQPDHAEAHSNLGTVLKNEGKRDAAETMYAKALELNPTCIEALNSLGLLRYESGEIGRAIECFKRMLRIDEHHSGACINMGNMMKEWGKHQHALSWYRKAAEREPGYHDAHTNILLTMHYDDEYSPEDIFKEHRRWGMKFDDAAACDMFPAAEASRRPLRIGYMSPDFRRHPVSFFIEPVIEGHDRANVTVHCYADVKRRDDVTDRIRERADSWVDITGMQDREVERLIRNDGIDILVDLAGHTGDNRIKVFADRPAPVQVTYLGYPDTTGLCAVDYRISDALADPPGNADTLHTEKLVRIPDCFLCYRPYCSDSSIADPPVFDNGYITFGSFCNSSKVTPRMVALWSEILHNTENARLHLKSRQLTDDNVVKYYADMFLKHGISKERIQLSGHVPSYRQHIESYNRIDIALDTFPYNGTTTTCEALWMGVPVITLCGDRHSSRVGSSLLTTIGHHELIAENVHDYVKKAMFLAANTECIDKLRRNLRKHMKQSALCDERGYVEHLEHAYRAMWLRYCSSQSGYQVA